MGFDRSESAGESDDHEGRGRNSSDGAFLLDSSEGDAKSEANMEDGKGPGLPRGAQLVFPGFFRAIEAKACGAGRPLCCVGTPSTGQPAGNGCAGTKE